MSCDTASTSKRRPMSPFVPGEHRRQIGSQLERRSQLPVEDLARRQSADAEVRVPERPPAPLRSAGRAAATSPGSRPARLDRRAPRSSCHPERRNVRKRLGSDEAMLDRKRAKPSARDSATQGFIEHPGPERLRSGEDPRAFPCERDGATTAWQSMQCRQLTVFPDCGLAPCGRMIRFPCSRGRFLETQYHGSRRDHRPAAWRPSRASIVRSRAPSFLRQRIDQLRSEFMATDDQGRSWTIDPEFQRWGHLEGERWLVDDPPPKLFAISTCAPRSRHSEARWLRGPS